MFGRKRKQVEVEETLDEELVSEGDHGDADDLALDDTEEDLTPDILVDEWVEIDQSRDWREDGPFDIDEVDLDADDVTRIDLGTLVITPFSQMQVQFQVNQATNKVQVLLVSDGKSAIEVMLIGKPQSYSILPEIRQSLLDATADQGGTAEVQEGPFGPQVHRVIPVTTPEGKQMSHVSTTWLAEGPRWVLRGVLMGAAAQEKDLTTGAAEELYEFFANLVVNRGNHPAVPGGIIEMSVPEQITGVEG